MAPRLWILIVALAAAGVAPAAAEAWGVAQLMAGFQAVKSSRAHFVERRHLAMLSEPLRSTGTLAYTAPDKLEKVTLSPRPERLAIDGDRVTIDQGPDGIRNSFALSARPEIGAFIESIRGMLAGDRPALERYYTLGLEGAAASWTVRLEPKDPALKQLVSSIRITGAAASIHTVETQESGGDRAELIVMEDPP
ncbi:MAG: outer membrane lipoprotein carrier protein LolA [Proteobacteria bacterium]|nr:outer membrane lipoprotein carrier protein LolA [Pseudomonadota bacterium]